ncbi:uncharacterized protein METZ01_LOCUS249101 [marine metagenome]|uniref:Uncharacterized protein n=1 Tax=marine metagenome TaxID=408172 RepID=A0A382IAH5_9ZZZZ
MHSHKMVPYLLLIEIDKFIVVGDVSVIIYRPTVYFLIIP